MNGEDSALIPMLRERLRVGREKLREAHYRGVPGIQVCTALTDLLDSVILDLFQHALEQSVDEQESRSLSALVAHGGYGRRDVAPYSDVDLMLLHAPGAESVVAPLARRFTHGVYDVGLQLGFSLRTSRQACQLSMKDATIFTSLAESRFMAGSVSLYTRYMASFRRASRRNLRRLVPMMSEARRDERRQYGETVYLLEPNVKRSRGGLRDIQLIRWIGFARHGHPELELLEQLGFVLPAEKRKLRESREFLLRLRNELHFHANRAQDVLDKGEQLRIAELHSYQGSEAVLPVEKFMQEYFEHTSFVRYAAAQFTESAAPATLGRFLEDVLATRHIGPYYKIGAKHVRATRRGLERLHGNLAEVLRVLKLASLTERRIHHETWQAIREDMLEADGVEITDEAVEEFLSLMSQPGRLGAQLRRLHELRVLEKLVPPMAHARGLLQFNEYHKYTVDEHTLRAVETVARMYEDEGPLGEAYRSLGDRGTLHLAMLFHDLGKGYSEDHSVLGAEMAGETCQRLGLPENETELVQKLVLKHLRLAHVAFRQNLDDESVIVRFAVEIESSDALKMLYLLTAADIASVGPGVLNGWKLELLTELFRRTERQLAGAEFANTPHLQAKRDAVVDAVCSNGEASEPEREAWKELVASLPTGYLAAREPKTIVTELKRVRDLPAEKMDAWGRYDPDRKAVEYIIGAHESATHGIFHRLTGALTSHRTQILSAEIHTLADGLVLDRFYVDDMDFSGSPPEERLQQISQALVEAALDRSGNPPKFSKVWSAKPGPSLPAAKMENRIRIDNRTSDSHTIVNVFTYDRIGLLYQVSRTLYELGLSVYFAKIATHIDQVVDVFYVTDDDNQKILDTEWLECIKSRLHEAISTDSSESGESGEVA